MSGFIPFGSERNARAVERQTQPNLAAGELRRPGGSAPFVRRRRPSAPGLLQRPHCRRRGTAIDAAVDTGAQRILYTSAHGTAFDTPYPPLAIHAATEQHLAASGIAWTSLRNGFYGDPAQLVGAWQETGVIAMPADGPFSWIDRRDAAEAAAAILTVDDPFDGPIDLTLPRPVTLADFATSASELSGRQIERVVVDDETWVAGATASGTPEAVARFTLSMFQATRTGHFSGTDPTLSRLLGREPRSIFDQLKDRGIR